MGLNTAYLAKTLIGGFTKEALPTSACIPRPVPFSQWANSAFVIEGEGQSLFRLAPGLGFISGTFAALLGGMTADMLLNPDKYTGQFSDADSAPVEQPLHEPEIIEQPAEPINDSEPVAENPATPQSVSTTSELIESGHTVDYALFFGAGLAACQRYMAAELFLENGGYVTAGMFGEHIAGRQILNFRNIPTGQNPLIHAFDQFLGNRFSTFPSYMYMNSPEFITEIGDEKLSERFSCAFQYMMHLNNQGLISNDIRSKVNVIIKSLKEYAAHIKKTGDLSAETQAQLRNLIDIIEAVLYP